MSAGYRATAGRRAPQQTPDRRLRGMFRETGAAAWLVRSSGVGPCGRGGHRLERGGYDETGSAHVRQLTEMRAAAAYAPHEIGSGFLDMADLDEFTEVYNKATTLLQTKCFDQRWSNIEPQLKALLAADGPDGSQAAILETVRTTLAKAGKGPGNVAEAIAAEILAVSRSGENGFQDRAALIKLFKHFYYVTISGNQDIWVVDHPKGFSKWSFDECSGKTADALKRLLQEEDETFGAARRKIMSDALQVARKWSHDILIKLTKPDDATLGTVKRWFHGDTADDADVKRTAEVLQKGFKSICGTLNSTRVIFSDHPPERTGGKYGKTMAEVSSVDAMPVIYIFPFFFLEVGINNKGQVGKMWLCALTIIHELSHKLAGTDDNSYDDLGLKPGGRNLTVRDAIKTADSWGYFACDMAGCLPKDAFTEFYK
jgi:hypothetical protein